MHGHACIKCFFLTELIFLFPPATGALATAPGAFRSLPNWCKTCQLPRLRPFGPGTTNAHKPTFFAESHLATGACSAATLLEFASGPRKHPPAPSTSRLPELEETASLSLRPIRPSLQGAPCTPPLHAWLILHAPRLETKGTTIWLSTNAAFSRALERHPKTLTLELPQPLASAQGH